MRWSLVLLLIFVETHWDHPLDSRISERQVCQNSLAAIMSCTRVVLELIVAGGQGTDPLEKTKGHLKGWPDCLLCLAPRVGFESTTGDNGRIPKPPLGRQSIKSIKSVA